MQPSSLISRISDYQAKILADTPISAAVLLLLMADEKENLFILVTKRPDTIATYAGDYCFPGGMRESIDTNLKSTAMREAEEELAIKPDDYNIIGQLDDLPDRYGNLVRPFVGMISRRDFETKYKKSDEEVAEIYYFPLADLQYLQVDADLEKILKRHPAYAYRRDNVFIWGLTATIMVRLREILS